MHWSQNARCPFESTFEQSERSLQKMSQQEDLREVTVIPTHSSWPPKQPQESSQCSSQCQRRLLAAVFVSVLLLFITIVGLLCAFCLFIYPRLSTDIKDNPHAAQLSADIDYNRTVKWLAAEGLPGSYLGAGFHLENQELHSTKDGMYYVYARLKVTCPVQNQCNSALPVKLELQHCTGRDNCNSLLNMEVKLLHEAEGTFDQSSTLVYMTSKSWLQATVHGLQQKYVSLDDHQIYFGAFLIQS